MINAIIDNDLLSQIRWLLWFLYCCYILTVPFCYIRIFVWRKFQKFPGSGKFQEEEILRRRKRNVVTFSYNMIIWLVEAICTFLVG